MFNLRLLLILPMAFTFTACNDNLLANEVPVAMFVTPESSRRYEGLPLALTEKLESLKIDEANLIQEEIGYSPELKIQAHDVKAYVEYQDGWLIASGYGEWGGIVFWVSKRDGYKIIHNDDYAYPIDVLLDENKVLIVQGMNHLGSSEGYLLELERSHATFETHSYPINLYPGKFEKHDEEWIVPIASSQTYFVVSELRAGRHSLHKRN